MLCIIPIIPIVFLPLKSGSGRRQRTGRVWRAPHSSHIVFRGIIETHIRGTRTYTGTTTGKVYYRFICIDFFDKACILICRKVSGFNCIQQFFLILAHEIKNLVFIGAIISCCDKEKEKSATQDI